MSFLRLLGAALFVWFVMLAAVVLLSGRLEGAGFMLGAFGILAAGVGAVVVAMWIFGQRAGTAAEGNEAFIRSLEEKNELDVQAFTALRAFQVEELEDEGLHYFIELASGGVLYLTGQYLYDYEAVDDDPELEDVRRFPCTEFVIRRHLHQGYVIDIRCTGEVLEPEVVAPAFTEADYESNEMPEDGDILDGGYDELKARRMAAGG